MRIRRTISGVSTEPLPAPPPLAPRDLRQLVDRVVSDQLEAHGIAGAAVSIVLDGEIALSRGHGYADLRQGVPVDADRTLFRAGSVSKLLTWTAVMQLLEQGLLDESADLGEYVDFPLRRAYPDRITIRHLMTHATGYESNNFGYMAARRAGTASLGLTVARHAPEQVRPPGQLASYTNWGAALAGRIVELRTGLSFDEYVERKLLGPLQMSRSTFREPLPAHFGAAPVGYVPGRDGLVEHPFEYYGRVSAAGSLTTTATDMAAFMAAHLRGGAFRGARILTPESVHKMHSRVEGFHACLDGAALGFYETQVNGRRGIGHKGRTVCFESRLLLLPQERLGIFIAANTASDTAFCDAVVQDLCDAWFPARRPALPARGAIVRNDRYAGSYAFTARSHSKCEKLFGLCHTVEVSGATDGGLLISGLVSGEETRWLEVEAGNSVFRRADGDEMIAFEFDGWGRAVRILGPDPFNPAERLRLLDTPRFTRCVKGIAPSAFALCGFAAFSAGHSLWPGAAWLAAFLSIAQLLILLGMVRAPACNQYSALVRLPWPLVAAAVLATSSLALTLAIAGCAISWWSSGVSAAGACAAFGALAVLSAAFSAWLGNWNLIGLRLA